MSTTSIKITSLSLMLWLFMTISTLAQSENEQVLDTKGQPLESGKEYYIRSYILDIGGRITLINRQRFLCPLNVGQENTDLGKGLPVIFTPFVKDDKFVKVNKDFKVNFTSSSTCGSTEWKLGDRDTRSGRRLIIADSDGSYFRIVKAALGTYTIRFCPTDTCSSCRFDCGTVGTLRENLNNLLALDGGALRVEFERA